MQPRNLAYQGKPEPGSLAIAGELEERQKDLLALRLGDAAARIDDGFRPAAPGQFRDRKLISSEVVRPHFIQRRRHFALGHAAIMWQ